MRQIVVNVWKVSEHYRNFKYHSRSLNILINFKVIVKIRFYYNKILVLDWLQLFSKVTARENALSERFYF